MFTFVEMCMIVIDTTLWSFWSAAVHLHCVVLRGVFNIRSSKKETADKSVTEKARDSLIFSRNLHNDCVVV